MTYDQIKFLEIEPARNQAFCKYPLTASGLFSLDRKQSVLKICILKEFGWSLFTLPDRKDKSVFYLVFRLFEKPSL